MNGDAGIKTTFLIGDNVGNSNNIDITYGGQLGKYLDLFNDISSGNSFKILVTDKNENSGINFENNNDYEYFEINNSTMIPNIEFMEKIIFEKMSLSVVLSQNPMTIVLDSSIVDTGAISAAQTNKALFGVN